jgi:hypothetical protein
VLLIEANAQQAKLAGASQVSDILTKLTKRISFEKERTLPDEQVPFLFLLFNFYYLLSKAFAANFTSFEFYRGKKRVTL